MQVVEERLAVLQVLATTMHLHDSQCCLQSPSGLVGGSLLATAAPPTHRCVGRHLVELLQALDQGAAEGGLLVLDDGAATGGAPGSGGQ